MALPYTIERALHLAPMLTEYFRNAGASGGVSPLCLEEKQWDGAAEHLMSIAANGSTNAPKTAAKFANMTVIGPILTSGSSGINANYQNGTQIRRNSSISIFNSLIIGFPVGVYIDDTKGSKTIENVKAGSLMFKGNIIAGCTTKWKGESSATTDSTAWNAFKSASGTTELASAADVLMTDPNKFSSAVSTSAGTPNYLLQTASPAATGAVPDASYGMQDVTYRGAFDASNDWTKGWTTWAAESATY